MNAVMHDTLAISERLKQAGLPEPAAKAVAREIVSTVEDKAATKADVQEIVRGEIVELRKDMRHFMTITVGVMTLLLVLFGILMKVVH